MIVRTNAALEESIPEPIRYAADSILIVDPIVPQKAILSNFNTFWTYYTEEVKLYEDFQSYDAQRKRISKGEFLKQLTTGRYFPLLLFGQDETLIYKLEIIGKKADPIIGAYMKQFSNEELIFYRMQGKPMPDFRFEDIEGNVFTSKNTLGKVVLLKCWFIGCVACVQEMPNLNKLVKAHKDRSDIIYISVAPDSKVALKKFFSSRHFNYSNTFGQDDYLQRINISSYPTHFLIGKDGKVFRVLKDVAALSAALTKYLSEKG
ncbi:MAG: TlpA family protein disulfide reductase [Sphingobacteriales bacterium]|nr:MAG: TlpA family protein disulfide reductase [Sphingobacteriales bacterium]